MADRTVRTILELNASRFTAGAAQASMAAKSLSADMARLGGAGSKLQADYSRVSTGILGMGVALSAGMGLAAKSAIDWESAWAGVRKTVDGSDAELGALEQQLRGLAKTLPATHSEIAGVAEAAGQLGIAREDIASFTKVMIDLGETTNLSAEEAATAIAQFSNIMGTSSDEADNLGSALVALGNAGASTEADILAMASRLASTGALIGASEQDILGLSSALADVGISAEAGGGSISRVLQKMNTEVLSGGEKLQEFARIAGMSADEFSAKWRSSPIEAFDAFIQGLNGVTASGGNAVGVLKDLGIKSSEETRAVLSLAAAGDHLSGSLDTSNQGWAANIALVEEASKRYETSEAKIQIARNALVDVGIDLGGVVLPMLASAAEGVASLAGAFSALPGPVQSALATFGTLAGATGLVVGGVMKLVPAISDTVGAFRALQTSAPGVADGLGKVGKAALLTGTALAALGIADSIVLPFVSSGQVTELDKYAASILRLSNGDAATGIRDLNSAFTSSDWFSGLDVGGLKDAYSIITDPTFAQSADNVVSRILTLGQRGSSDMEFVNREWSKLDQTLAGMASSGNMDQLNAALQQIASQTGVSVEELLKSLPAVASAMELYTAQTEAGAGAAGEFEGATGGATDALEEQAAAVDNLVEGLSTLMDIQLGSRAAARDFEAALDDAAASIEKNGQTLDKHTEAGRENEAALDDIASATKDLVQAQHDAGEGSDVLAASMQRGRDEFLRIADAMGMAAPEAEALADSLGLTSDTIAALPEAAKVEVEAQGAMEAQAQAEQLQAALNALPPEVRTVIDAVSDGAVLSAEQATVALDGIPELKKAYIDGDMSGLQTGVDTSYLLLAGLNGASATPNAYLNDENLILSTHAAVGRLEELNAMTPTPQVLAEIGVLSRQVDAAKSRLNSIPPETIADVIAKTYSTLR